VQESRTENPGLDHQSPESFSSQRHYRKIDRFRLACGHEANRTFGQEQTFNFLEIQPYLE